MNKSNLLSTLLICALSAAIFVQCGDSDKKMNDAEKSINEGTEVLEDGKEQVEEGMNDTKEKMEKMESKEGMLTFQAGTWEDQVLQAVKSGQSMVFTLDQIPFEGDDLSDAGKEQLDNLAAILKDNPEWKIEVQGHTEGPGKKLGGLARAKWVQLKMNARGIVGKQISAKGYGAERLIPGLEETDEKHRRVTIELSK